MYMEEYFELLRQIHDLDNEKIYNVNADYNTKSDKITSVTFTVFSGEYVSCTKDDYKTKELIKVTFSHDDCTVENIKKWIDSL